MDFWQNYGLVIVLGVVLAIALTKIARMRAAAKTAVAPPTSLALRAEAVALEEEIARAEYESMPKCVCGEIARYPAPVLKRDRGAWDWLRSYFAAPPRYKREVDLMLTPVFCAAHVHVADALMDQFIFRIRGEYSTLNAKIAADAAGFEQEALLKCVAESLTDLQKRAVRKAPATIRVLPVKVENEDVSNG